MLKICVAALVGVALLGWTAAAADAPPAPWQVFQAPPPLPAPDLEGRVAHDGAEIWFAAFGSGPPVILLHGGTGESDNFGFQVPALVADGHRVIVIDSRDQGRSTKGPHPLSYELMESDVIAVMDALSIRKAAVIGWSDGGIIGLIMAMKDPDRETRVFAFGANMDTSGLRGDGFNSPILKQVVPWSQATYARISPTPTRYADMVADVAKMSETQPSYTAARLARISGPAIAIADGDHEEFIKLEHARYLARTIPHATLIILEDVSHFAPVQDPAQFNRAAIAFIDGR